MGDSIQTPQATEHEPESALLEFLKSLSSLLPIEKLRASVRVTPRGLFVTEEFEPEIVGSYQQWLEKKTGGEITKSLAKCKKRLFGSLEPRLSYLIEGKICLTGFEAECPLSNPQSFGLPYFLGSLTATTDYLHIHDPTLKSLQNVTAVPTPTGVQLDIQCGQSTLHVAPQALKDFRSLAEHSPRTLKEFPDLTTSLSETAKALVRLLRKSRPIPTNWRVLVPQKFLNQKNLAFRSVGGFTFIFDRNENLIFSYEARGKNLFHFVREEFAELAGKNIGIFSVFPPRARHLGEFKMREASMELSVRAFIYFLEHLPHSPDKREQFQSDYTVRQCFDRFSEIFQGSEHIEKRKLGEVLERHRLNPKSCRINGPWIFAMAKGYVIEACVAKHIKERR